jgi:peptidoglycan hydrolase-like protein with peptidoglycan-binding domain
MVGGSNETLLEDGDFGPGTDTAVRNFQRNNGLGVDGIVGLMTRTKLTSSDTGNSNPNLSVCPYSEPAATLTRGSRGTGVSWLQWYLNKKGASPQLLVDGDFGPATDTAVRSFQRNNGLSVDGAVGPLTRARLKA